MIAYDQLRRVSLFADLDDDALRALADRAKILHFKADEPIASQTDSIREFYIVLSGRVKIFRSNLDGKEQILYLIGGGQPFCFCTAFSNKPYPVDVTALDDTVVADIPATAMEDLARREPLLMLKIMQTLAARLLEAMNLVESLSLQGTPERIAYYLLQAEKWADVEPGDTYRLPVAHKELAKILGTTPETLSRVIQKFKRNALIEASGRNIRILNAEGLGELADAS